MADTTVIQEKREKSGIRKYFTPSMAPGLVTVYTQMMTAITTSSGIMIPETFSMPFFTPRMITPRVAAEKTRNQNSPVQPSARKEVKKDS